MTTIEINKTGKIIKGDYFGWSVRILNDKDYTGGFLVLLISPFNPQDSYDHWVSDARELNAWFAAQGWEIDWNDDGIRLNS
mgnify:FL=1|jgi:hypothetical protein